MKIITQSFNFKKFFTTALSICLLFLCNDSQSQKNINNLENRLTEVIDSFYTYDSLPGIITGVWTPDFTYKKTVGKADINSGTDRTFDDKIRIGSITKTFVGTVLLQLVDSGKIGLDDKLSKYFTDYPNAENITIRQMMDMTSGIPDYIEDPGVLKSFVYDRTDKYTPAELYAITKSMGPDFPPGTKWNYSNGNYNILGMIIEMITGNKLESEIERRIIKPLGLTNTTFPTSPYMEGQYSHGYMRDTLTGEFIDVTLIDPSIGWAAGAMVSNLPDLRTYAYALSKGTLISAKSQEERLKFINVDAEGILEEDVLKYGLGIFTFGGFIGHNGGIPGFNTTMCYNPELDALIIVSVNEFGMSQGNSSDAIFMKIAEILYPDKNFFGK